MNGPSLDWFLKAKPSALEKELWVCLCLWENWCLPAVLWLCFLLLVKGKSSSEVKWVKEISNSKIPGQLGLLCLYLLLCRQEKWKLKPGRAQRRNTEKKQVWAWPWRDYWSSVVLQLMVVIALKVMAPGNAFIRDVVKEKGGSFPPSREDTAFNSYKEEWVCLILLAKPSKAMTVVLRHNKLRFPSGSLSQLVSGQVAGNAGGIPPGTLRNQLTSKRHGHAASQLFWAAQWDWCLLRSLRHVSHLLQDYFLSIFVLNAVLFRQQGWGSF